MVDMAGIKRKDAKGNYLGRPTGWAGRRCAWARAPDDDGRARPPLPLFDAAPARRVGAWSRKGRGGSRPRGRRVRPSWTPSTRVPVRIGEAGEGLRSPGEGRGRRHMT